MNQQPGLILCLDSAEARLLRQQGHKCVTAAKFRRQLTALLMTGAENAADEAAQAVGRLSGISSADDPQTWPLWKKIGLPDPLRQAFKAAPVIKTPFTDPEDFTILPPGEFWQSKGTTVFVALNTFELVRVADTYAARDCYRPKGRMDEPFTPQPGRVCLITEDELRLLRLDGISDPEIVTTYIKDDSKGAEGMTGRAETPPYSHHSAIRALAAEWPALRVGLAPTLAPHRPGYPFVLGLSRGLGFETVAVTDTEGSAALDFCIETNIMPKAERLQVVTWAGGNDIKQLARYGGLTIFIGGGKRRKVQLRSLGLVRSGTVAGVPMYDFTENRTVLRAWAVTRQFERQEASMRNRNRRRVRCRKSVTPIHQGDIYNTLSPCGIQVTPASQRKAAAELRHMWIAETFQDGGVSTVHLKTLREGGSYYLNGRAFENDEGKWVEGKRSKIRTPHWDAEDTQGLLEWLKESPAVIMAGKDRRNHVFAVVRVANGTEDQQNEAIARWSDEVGRLFPDDLGRSSWNPASVLLPCVTCLGSLVFSNWRAQALRTDIYEPYQHEGDYGKPLKLEREGTASASERAGAYVRALEGLNDAGSRNTRLASAMLNIRDTFGAEILGEVLPDLLAKSGLPEKEKRRMARRILRQRVKETEG